ncbi:MAG: element excision factor XisI family protein [Nostoc sp. DedQUE08]|uniref:element excision factor XisI family protein n=1 Tax=unclassified Nostoc TaxID=2593658 RepID=UPI002AD5856E|nr:MULTISPECIES: element excision factor XisI family protein [unclassified Nostoc]MDZ8069628.1 element excision factor XisI family protein [Nostoc sp. DedQUE08]MDZ8095845.1 element excision factor XisI family protein [Nostoc sp. DedQUE05]
MRYLSGYAKPNLSRPGAALVGCTIEFRQKTLSFQFVTEGVPKQDIVIAYHAPHVRQYTEFAVG